MPTLSQHSLQASPSVAAFVFTVQGFFFTLQLSTGNASRSTPILQGSLECRRLNPEQYGRNPAGIACTQLQAQGHNPMPQDEASFGGGACAPR